MPFRSHFWFHRHMFSGRFIGVLHLNQNSAGNRSADIDFSKNTRMAKTNEIVERAGIGNNSNALPVQNGCDAGLRFSPTSWTVCVQTIACLPHPRKRGI